MASVTVAFCILVTPLAHGAVLHGRVSSSGGIQIEQPKNMINDPVKATMFDGYLSKAVWAQSARSIDTSIAWKMRYLPVRSDLQVHQCGNNSRFDLANLTMGTDPFSLHAVYAAGVGGSRSATSGEISVEGIEDILDEVVDGSTYSAWMDNHFALYRYDIESLISKFQADGQKFVVLSWDADGLTFYSVIARVPKSQEIYEFISSQKPASAEEIVRFPVSRHFFGGRFQIQEQDARTVPLHVSLTTRDLAHSLTFFKDVFGQVPVTQGTFDGGRYAIFDMTVYPDGTPTEVNMHDGQVQLWERDDAKSGTHSPAWFEEYVESVTLANYSGSLETCWNVWGDNHFTFYGVPGAYISQVIARYEELGYPHKEFSSDAEGSDPSIFSAYFMLPGGRWMEMHPKELTPTTSAVEVWDKNYCYAQSCS